MLSTRFRILFTFFIVLFLTPAFSSIYAQETSGADTPANSIEAPELSAVAQSSSEISLSWNAVEGAISYEIYRDDIHIASTAATSYTDSELSAAFTYTYYVRAIGSSAFSKSNIISASPNLTAPVIKTASVSYNSIIVSWNAVEGAEGYEVYRSTSKDGSYKRIKTTAALSFTNTKLTCGKVYYYKVRAFRSTEDGISRSSFSSIKNRKPVPAAPGSVKAAASYDHIDVTWDKVTGATAYYVYRSTEKDSGYTRIAALKKECTYTDPNLKHGITYYYKIRAVRNSIKGTPSLLSATPKCSAPKVSLQQSTYHTVTLSWKSIKGAASYNIYRSPSKEGPYTKIKNTAATEYIDTGLTCGTTYHYKVFAVRNGRNGRASSIRSSSLYLGTPGSFAVKANGTSATDGAKLSWKSVTGAETYTIFRSTKADRGFTKIGSSNSASYIDTSVKKGTSYYYKIQARSGSTTSSFSKVRSFIWAKTADYHLDELTVSTNMKISPVLTVSPAASMPSSCRFTSSNPAVAKVNASGTITTLAAGTTTITCKPYSSSKETSLKLTVVEDAITIVLDPGHGGSDSGAVATHKNKTYYERDLNLKISLYTQKALSAYTGVIVYLTRTTNDVLPGLEERTEIASEYYADLFVSQHLNSAYSSSTNGSEVYTSVNPAYQMNDLAELIAAELKDLGLKQRGVFSKADDDDPAIDYYGVLRHSTKRKIPSVLIENAFISSPSDVSKYLNSNAKLKKIAAANAAAIVKYYDLTRK